MFSGLFVMQATLAFWTVESLEAVNIFTYGGEAVAEYPMNVYAGWFRNFMTFVVPVGCVTYLPMLAAMGRADPLGAPALDPAARARGRLRFPRRGALHLAFWSSPLRLDGQLTAP